MTNLVQLKDVSKTFGTTPVFQRVSFDIQAREHMALLGPSGCGKSTILRILTGLDSPTDGEVRVSGRLASRAGQILVPPHQREMAMVFQDLALWPNLTVLENVALGLAGADLPRQERARRSLTALEACGIDSLAKRMPASLSGGQQQRVALARALAVQPKLLLLDEPFSGLDIAIKARLCAEIRQLSDDYELTVTMVSHDPMEAMALCSQVVVLEDGAIREKGRLDALLANPRSETLHTFVEHLPTRSHTTSRAREQREAEPNPDSR